MHTGLSGIYHGGVIVKKIDSYIWRPHGDNATFSVEAKAFYKMERQYHESVIRDLDKSFYSPEEKNVWLKQGQIVCRNRYLLTMLGENTTIKTLMSYLSCYDFSLNKTIIVVKAILKIIGFKKIKI